MKEEISVTQRAAIKLMVFPRQYIVVNKGKHIPSHNNYQKGKSIFYGSEKKAQDLINKYAGTGQWMGSHKERVNFGKVIGSYVDNETGKTVKTTVGIIHYSKTGAHIVPAAPIE